jgi:hypothetical protein
MYLKKLRAHIRSLKNCFTKKVYSIFFKVYSKTMIYKQQLEKQVDVMGKEIVQIYPLMHVIEEIREQSKGLSLNSDFVKSDGC